jgi:Acyl-CoA reductase (LuxC)
MTAVDVVLPAARRATPESLVASIKANTHSLRPFDPRMMHFARNFSRALRLHDASGRFPELAALAFWLRPAGLRDLERSYQSLIADDSILVPRGLAFHVPPANVDTIFVYSWILCALAGNASIVRLSATSTEPVSAICEVLCELLARREHVEVAETVVFLRYGHEREITAALSAACDIRVLWGGDDTVTAIRSLPLAPHATELTFADRFSLAVIDARALLALEDRGLRRLASQFFHDAYWFNQMGCSSPRAVFWRGSRDETESAQASFYRVLADECARRGYEAPLSAVIAKLTHAFIGAGDGFVDAVHRYSNETTTVSLSEPANIDRASPGAGLFCNARIDGLEQLRHLIQRKDQTLSYFGVDATELRAFAQELNGRGVERIVPIGNALSFGRLWDGYDLLQAFSRRVHVQRPAPDASVVAE